MTVKFFEKGHHPTQRVDFNKVFALCRCSQPHPGSKSQSPKMLLKKKQPSFTALLQEILNQRLVGSSMEFQLQKFQKILVELWRKIPSLMLMWSRRTHVWFSVMLPTNMDTSLPMLTWMFKVSASSLVEVAIVWFVYYINLNSFSGAIPYSVISEELCKTRLAYA